MLALRGIFHWVLARHRGRVCRKEEDRPGFPRQSSRRSDLVSLDGSQSRSVTLVKVIQSLYDIDPGPESPELVRMIVEIPKNSTNKYEYDGKLAVFRLDRALYSPMHYPGDYGFIPGTLAEDGDPMDVLALVQDSSFPGVMIEVRPVGILNMVDQEERDLKVLAVPNRNPRFDQWHTID